MADNTGVRGAILGGGGMAGAAIMRAIDVAETAMKPEVKGACQSALEVMSQNLSVCMQMTGGG